MKLKSIQVQNLGPIADGIINCDQPLTAIYGQPEVGKSTMLHAITWAGGGKFPADIIKHGCEEAFIHLVFENATIRREFYRAGDNTTKAREVKFVRDNEKVNSPVEAIKKLLNPFLLDARYFIDKNDKDRQLFLIELLGVKTPDEDAVIVTKTQEAANARLALDRLGERGVVSACVPLDLDSLRVKRATMTRDWQAAVNARSARHTQINAATTKQSEIRQQLLGIMARRQELDREFQASSSTALQQVKGDIDQGLHRDIDNIRATAAKKIKEIEAQLQIDIDARSAKWNQDINAAVEANYKRHDAAVLALREVDAGEARLKEDLAAIVVPEPLPEPVLDTVAVDTEIASATQVQIQYQAYIDYTAWQEKKNSAQATLRLAEAALKEARDAKRARLAGMSSTCPIVGMTFTDDGIPLYEGTSMDMLSDSKMMRLSSAISALYPTDIGIEIVDRGESMGKRVWELIDYADKNKRSVLTTIVGDVPAEVPDRVGVFVIENGTTQQVK